MGLIFSQLSSKLFAGTTGVLLVLLALSHCSDKRHTRQRDEARAEVDMLKRASEQVRKEQVAIFAENQRLNERIVTDAQTRRIELNSALDSVLDDYRRSHRLPESCRRFTSKTIAAPVHPDPQAPAGKDATAELLAIPAREWDQTARAAVLSTEQSFYLDDLRKLGLAVAVDENGRVILPQPDMQWGRSSQ